MHHLEHLNDLLAVAKALRLEVLSWKPQLSADFSP